MNILTKTIIALFIVIVIGIIYLVGIYNSMVGQQQGVKAAWSQVENTYQRRADLIPNLVKTVKGYAALRGLVKQRREFYPLIAAHAGIRRFTAAVFTRYIVNYVAAIGIL